MCFSVIVLNTRTWHKQLWSWLSGGSCRALFCGSFWNHPRLRSAQNKLRSSSRNPRLCEEFNIAGDEGITQTSCSDWGNARDPEGCVNDSQALHCHYKDARRRACCRGKNTLKFIKTVEIAAVEHRHRKRYREWGACLSARERRHKCACARGRERAPEDTWTSSVNTVKKYINKIKLNKYIWLQ